MATKPSKAAAAAAAAAATEDTGADTVTAAAADTAEIGTRADADGATTAAVLPVATTGPDTEAKRMYVSTSVDIRHDGGVYPPGKQLALTEREAERLGALVMPAAD